jgi:uncharacterized protein YgbK (DUF1537 family)
VTEAFNRLRDAGVRMAIVDALDEDDLKTIGTACAELPLVTGGSGVAIGLPENFRRQGRLAATAGADALPRIHGKCAVVSGSCSRATQEQVEIMKRACPAFRIDPLALADRQDAISEALDWARPRLDEGPVLIFATAAPDDVRAVQDRLGAERAGELVERALAEIAKGLVAAGVRNLVVAGGETSGAVVNALGVKGLRIGPQIDPGVPWTASLGEPPLALALKSGNFGSPDFFLKAFKRP